MDHESEVIRQQMEETRNSLVGKLENLEQQVTETVQGTTSAVASVAESVENVKDTVQETVENVKDVVQDTMTSVGDSVRHAVDLSGHMERHPWMVLGGSVALGFLVGQLLPSRSASYGSRQWVNNFKDGSPEVEAKATSTPATPAQSTSSDADQGSMFGNEISKLKGLAVGALFGVVRDMVQKAVPDSFREQMTEVINGVTGKLGGEVISGPVLANDSEDSSSPAAAAEESNQWSGGRPVGNGPRSRQSEARVTVP